MLEIKHFTLRRHNDVLITDFSATVENGQVLSIMGPSGIGKSSLLSFISGSLPRELSATGEVYLNGVALHNLPVEARKIGLLQQAPLLFPHMSILENLCFAIPAKFGKQQRFEKAYAALERLKIADKANNTADKLSGGQQARVALLRTLLSEPSCLLLDEPFSKLDPSLRKDVREFVLNEVKRADIPALLVTHDQEDADAMAGGCIELTQYTNA